MDERLLDAITATRRTIAEFEAVEAGLLAMALDAALRERAPGSGSDMPVRALAAEIGAATRRNDRTVEKHLDDARTLTTRFPATYAAFCEGRLSRAHVSAIVVAGTRIDDEVARAGYEQLAVAVGERESAGRLKGIATLLAEKVLPRPLDERHADAAEQRGVWVQDLDDGMSELRALLPSTIAHGIIERLTQMSRAVQGLEMEVEQTDAVGEQLLPTTDPDAAIDQLLPTADSDTTDHALTAVAQPAVRADGRALDQLRADLLADLALTGTPSAVHGGEALGAIRAEVLVTVPVFTLAGGPEPDGRTPTPAMLDGMTPIDPETARRLAGGASGWDRVLTHPITGAVLAVDRYRPSADLRRFLRAVDQRCRFPCCRRPAARCELDHLHEASRGGSTQSGNLASECKRHHVTRHAAGWRVARHRDGIVVWTSPTGRIYPDHPPGVHVRPAPPADDPDPPF